MSSGQLIVASAARTTSSNSGTLDTLEAATSQAKAAVFWLSITADESTAADRLNVYLQSSQDGGTTWQDFGAFTQAAGNTGNTTLVEQLSWVRETQDDEQTLKTDAALTAGTVQNGPVGPLWRVKWVVTNDSGSASFTFSVRARIITR